MLFYSISKEETDISKCCLEINFLIISFDYPPIQLKNLKNSLKKIHYFQKLHRRCSLKNGALRNFAKFTRKHLYQILFFKHRPATLLKKRPWHRCFPVNFVKFLRTPFLQKTLYFSNTQLRYISGCCYQKKNSS